MKVFNKDNNSIVEPNTKPHILNRIISALIDACIVFICFFGFYSLLISTSLADKMNAYQDEMTVIQDSLLYSTGMGVKKYDFKDKEEYKNYRVYLDENNIEYVIVGIDSPSIDSSVEEQNEYLNKYKIFQEKLDNDAAYSAAKTFYILNNFGIVSLSAFTVEGVFFLIIPLIDQKRRTIGKIIAKTELIHSKKFGKVKWYQVVGSFSWKLIVESLIPFVFLNQATFAATAFIQLTFVIINKDNQALHDLISRTKVVVSMNNKEISK